MSVVDACKLLHVSRSGYYAWRTRKPGKRARENTRLSAFILGIHTSIDERYKVRYGVRRMHQELRLGKGLTCTKKRVRRLMRQMGLYGTHYRRPWKTTIPARDAPVIPDLVKRNFAPRRAGMLWVTDITEVPLRNGKAYCAAIQDAFTKEVVGHAVQDTMETSLVMHALELALARTPKCRRRRLILHGDHGSQYTSFEYLDRLRQERIRPSFGSVGDCYDNALAESLNASLEKEFLRTHRLVTVEQARVEIFQYFEEFYNGVRRHSSIGYRTPREFAAA